MKLALSLLCFAALWSIGFATCALLDMMTLHHLNIITDSVIASVSVALVEWLHSYY